MEDKSPWHTILSVTASLIVPDFYNMRFTMVVPDFFYILTFLLLCICVFLTCMYVYHMCAWCFWRPKEGIRYSEAGDTSGCELIHGYWELNSGPLEE